MRHKTLDMLKDSVLLFTCRNCLAVCLRSSIRFVILAFFLQRLLQIPLWLAPWELFGPVTPASEPQQMQQRFDRHHDTPVKWLNQVCDNRRKVTKVQRTPADINRLKQRDTMKDTGPPQVQITCKCTSCRFYFSVQCWAQLQKELIN